MMLRRKCVPGLGLVWMLALAPLEPVFAAKHAAMPQAYVDECGGCHLPYAAEFLPVAAWKTLIAQLSDHFKVNAEGEAENLKAISQYLTRYAGPKSAFDAGPPKLKITESRWFLTTHRDAARGHWPKHKSNAQCQACHPGAVHDDFASLSDPNF